MTRGSTDRSDLTRRALDVEPGGRGLRPATARLLRLGAGLLLGLTFLLTQVANAAGAEVQADVAAVAGDPSLESQASPPETPPYPPEAEPPADPTEPTPAPPEPEPTPAPSEPEPTPAPSEPEPTPAPSEPEPTPAPSEPEPTEPPEVEPAPEEPALSEPTDSIDSADEQSPPPPTTPDGAPNVDAGDADGSAEERLRAPRSGRSPEPARFAPPEHDDHIQPVATARERAASTAEDVNHQRSSREPSGPMKARAPLALVREQPARSPIDGDRCDLGGIEGCADVVSASAASVIVIASPRIPTTVSVAVEFGKAGHGWAGAVVFNLWLRRQLRERRMSQRQLAHLSGVNHSTISRLLAGHRTPSLDTAAKLARALRVPNEEIGTELGFVADRPAMPTQRVEAALRGDADLDDTDVRELMDEYIARRRRMRLKAVDSAMAVRSAPAQPPDRPA
jgi:transcriptional regulator with XRE-family HTH domain